MNYEEFNKSCLEEARKLYQTSNADQKYVLEKLFPELKESEDEKIRKELIEQVIYIVPNSDEVDSEGNVLPTYQKRIDKYRAWLEKQGEQIDSSNKEYWRGYREGKQEILDKYAELEKQCEQKPTIEMKSEKESLGIDSATYNKIVDECIYGEQKPAELPKGEDYGIDGLYHAIRILEKTLGKVDGYQTDDGILEHECAISAVKNLYEQKPIPPEWDLHKEFIDFFKAGAMWQKGKTLSDVKKALIGKKFQFSMDNVEAWGVDSNGKTVTLKGRVTFQVNNPESIIDALIAELEKDN